VFLGPEEHLQVSGCPFAVPTAISEDHLSSQHQGCHILLITNNSPKWNQIQLD